MSLPRDRISAKGVGVENMQRRRKLNFAQRQERFEQALAMARSRADADTAVARILEDPDIETVQRSEVAASLGALQGGIGSAALREEALKAIRRMSSGGNARQIRMERDLLCTCICSLQRRDGAQATDVYISGLEQANLIVQDYSMAALAAVGDDSAWEIVYQRLVDLLRRPMKPSGLNWSQSRNAIVYLSRHALNRSDRAVKLISMIRVNWPHVADKEFVEKRISGISPGNL